MCLPHVSQYNFVLSLSLSLSLSRSRSLTLTLSPSSPFRYAFTILSNVGVFAAMFILLEFVHVPYYHPAIVINASSTAVSNSTSTISPNDLWIFSVSLKS